MNDGATRNLETGILIWTNPSKSVTQYRRTVNLGLIQNLYIETRAGKVTHLYKYYLFMEQEPKFTFLKVDYFCKKRVFDKNSILHA